MRLISLELSDMIGIQIKMYEFKFNLHKFKSHKSKNCPFCVKLHFTNYPELHLALAKVTFVFLKKYHYYQYAIASLSFETNQIIYEIAGYYFLKRVENTSKLHATAKSVTNKCLHRPNSLKSTCTTSLI